MRFTLSRSALLLSAALSAACAHAPAEGPSLALERFFAGETLGRGVLEYRDGSIARRFEVQSQGRASAQAVAIEQTIEFDDGETRTRRWTLTRTGPDTYRGTLTEASGPVRARRRDGALTLSYRLATVTFGRMRQSLTLDASGRRVINEGTVRVLGIVVRRMHEVIDIVDPAQPANPTRPPDPG